MLHTCKMLYVLHALPLPIALCSDAVQALAFTPGRQAGPTSKPGNQAGQITKGQAASHLYCTVGQDGRRNMFIDEEGTRKSGRLWEREHHHLT